MLTQLKLLRIKQCKTLRKAASELGMNETFLCRIERGQSYIPPVWRPKLAQALGVEVEEICDPETGWPRLVS